MLSGTCDVCQETAPFEDNLAGMTVRCHRCGQGWVRVPRTASVTAFVSDIADKGSTNSPDTAITDQRPLTRSAPLLDYRPAAGTCPQCGSASFTRVKTKRRSGLTNDRECKECGIRYTTIPAPLSSIVQMAMYASGVLLLLGVAPAFLLRLAETQPPLGAGFPCSSLSGVIFPLIMAFGVLRMPQQMQQLREKRLKEYQASASPDAPPPVEIPRPPDMVFLSGMFGVLSLTSPLVSSLLMVVLFGPAAVVCGVVALSQGHLKGLIGTVLGVASLIAWGLVFANFFQG